MTAGHVVPGVDPGHQRRVRVVCRDTRLDVSLPAHLEVVALLPDLVHLVEDHARAAARAGVPVDVAALVGADAEGVWRLSRTTGAPLEPSESLADNRVHDGDIVVLDRGTVPAPAPRLDDVLDALADPDLASTARFGGRDARRLAAVVAAAAWALALVAVVRDRLAGGGSAPLVLAALLALAVLALQSTRAAVVRGGAGAALAVAATTTPALAAALAVPRGDAALAAAVGGVVAASVGALLLRRPLPRPTADEPVAPAAPALAAVVLGGVGLATAAAAATAVPVHRVAVGAALAGVALVVAAPRLCVAIVRPPAPPLPAPGESPGRVDEAADLPTPGALRSLARRGSFVLASLLAGGAALVVGGTVVALATTTGESPALAAFAAACVVVLVLRGLTFVDRLPVTTVLVAAALLALGVVAGVVVTSPSAAPVAVPAAAAVAGVALGLGARGRPVRVSPSVRAWLTWLELAAIAASVPLALLAMDLLDVVRHR